MTQEQMAKRVTGIVVAATLFLVILFAVLVYQWVTMAVKQNRINRAEAEAASLAAQEQAYQEDLDDIMYDPITKNDLLIKYDNQN